ncbi:MAG: lipopolysaccharide assembly protein LapA domain-containing protein [Gaiellaceae bacterium]
MNPERRPRRLRRGLEEGRRSFQPLLWARLLVIGFVAVYAVLFIVLNTRRVHVSFVFVSTRVSLIWVILLSLGAGLVLGVLLSQLHRHRSARNTKR